MVVSVAASFFAAPLLHEVMKPAAPSKKRNFLIVFYFGG
jgi:hypothetical protein